MRIDPSAFEVELVRGLLGSPEHAAEVCIGLTPQHFADVNARPIAEGICLALAQQEQPSPARVELHLREAKIQVPVDIFAAAQPTTLRRLKAVAKVVIETGGKRLLAAELARLAEQVGRFTEDADEDLCGCIEMATEAVTRIASTGTVRIRTLAQIGDALVGKATEIHEGLRAEVIWRTGVEYLDRRFVCGPEQVGVFAADSGHGKTTMVDNVVAALLDKNAKLAAGYVPAADMNGEDMAAKNIGRAGEVDTNAVSGFRRPTADELAQTKAGNQRMRQRYGARYFVSESDGTDIADIEAQIRTMAMMMRDAGLTPGVFIVDYAQAVTWTQARGEFDALRELARRMKALAKALQICIIIASQLNAEGSRNVNNPKGKPEVSDIYGGSHLKFFATWVAMLIRREHLDANEAKPVLDMNGLVISRPTRPRALSTYHRVALWGLKGRFGGDSFPHILEFCGAHATYYEKGQSPLAAWNKAHPA